MLIEIQFKATFIPVQYHHQVERVYRYSFLFPDHDGPIIPGGGGGGLITGILPYTENPS